MAELATIARPYARAAFEQAQQEHALSKWSEMLAVLKRVVADPQMHGVITNPRLSDVQLVDIIVDICGDYLTATGRNFVSILAHAERLLVAPEISRQFEKQRADAEATVKVEVTSAFPLDPDQEQKLAEIMEQRLGRKIEVGTRVDDWLIGGAVIRAGDSVIDASLRGRLQQLANEFAE